MNPWDIAIIVIVCVAFAGVCGWLIYRKVKHKGGCCGCECGAHCQNCASGIHNEGNCGSGTHKAGGENACPHCKGEDKK